jgi:triphosphatase
LNENFLLDRRNPESLHQTRVALRRLRSAFSTFKPILRDAESERLKGELKWLAAVLGEARNVDVLLANAKDQEIRTRLFDARSTAYDNAVAALKSHRARSLALDFNQWLICGDWLSDTSTAESRATSAAEFAATALDGQRKRMKKHGDGFSETDDEHRHQVRKDAKKLRYAAEFFRMLFDGKKAQRRHRRFIELMEQLQDKLGALNDMATRPHVLNALGLETEVTTDGGKSKTKLMAAAEDALADLLEAKRFWR